MLSDRTARGYWTKGLFFMLKMIWWLYYLKDLKPTSTDAQSLTIVAGDHNRGFNDLC